ncbi:hypothetical protein HNY73_019274 [Argiope bruennichi]|uniref:Uncharacterized protein n=1 Tax=Argiope bruennichi TaxID=94029 RepID=A0A8T0EG98_ARGBR|nr:hypothetical protein HNY73_019274 [Argiope bruennichi]
MTSSEASKQPQEKIINIPMKPEDHSFMIFSDDFVAVYKIFGEDFSVIAKILQRIQDNLHCHPVNTQPIQLVKRKYARLQDHGILQVPISYLKTITLCNDP